MPRYFFHVKNGIPLVIDKVGKDLADLSEARAEAQRLAAEVSGELNLVLRLAKELHVEIADEAGKVLGFVNLDPKPGPRPQ